MEDRLFDQKRRPARVAAATASLALVAATGCDMLETAAPDDGATAGEVAWASPVAMVEGLAAPSTLAQWRLEIVWGDASGRVERMGKEGAGRATIADAPGEVTDLVLADRDIYWLDGASGRIWTAPIDEGEPRMLAITAARPEALAVDATSLYWTERGGRVMALSRYGGTPLLLAQLSGEVADLALDATSLYLTRTDAGTVESLPLYGGIGFAIATEQAEPGSIAVDGDQLYWATASAIMALDLTEPDAEPFEVASDVGRPDHLVVAGGYVYWTSRLDASVARAPRLGGTTVVVAEEQQGPGCVVVDTQAVFWAAAGTGDDDGAIWRAERE